jgi:hypothetical protein
LNDVVYNQRYLKNINDRFTALAHPHHEIFNLVRYVNCLTNLAHLVGTKIFFINAMCPWDQDFFSKLSSVLPEAYTEYTKKLINVDNRDDQEILQIYNKMHQQYDSAGGIQENYWLNLYLSLRSLLIDTNDDGVHPGIRSNRLYGKLLTTALSNKTQANLANKG